jgi:hypothetical protein
MGGVFWKGESREVAKPMAIIQLKMENTCTLGNGIETFWQKKMTKAERWKHSIPFKL